ncbi:MAG: hypothetical protein GY859_42155, partial [Desulfobacterales bacterium]|nr:hypothetical protein [Desulfobacterales bacterium]
ESNHLLLIGAYRDNEVTPAHPLALTLDAIEKQDVAVETIGLKTLSASHVTEMISETLHRDGEQVEPLARVIVEKTGGNPFFMKEFLTTLYKENFLRFDGKLGIWKWKSKRIREADFTDNVVDLMVNKIRGLPEETQRILKLAACIGSRFNLLSLSIACEAPLNRTAETLWTSLQEGLIQPIGEEYKYTLDLDEQSRAISAPKTIYRFLHDRVRQAAYKLLAREEKEESHLRIGRLLLAGAGKNESGADFTEVVKHMNLALPLIRDPDERVKLARMNLHAGLRAKKSAAYLSAIEHFKTGIRLLPENSWEKEYSLALNLYEERAECEYLSSCFEEGERLVGMLLERASSKMEKGRLYYLRTLYSLMAGKFEESVQTGIEGMKLFGVELPLDPDPDMIEKETGEIEKNMRGREISDLAKAPFLDDPEKILRIRILQRMFTSAYIIGNVPLLSLVVLKMTNIAMKYGDISGDAYSYYGIYLSALKRYKEAFEFARAAIEMSPESCSPIYIFGSLIGHFRIHLKKCAPYILTSIKYGIANGELTYSRYAAWFYSYHNYFMGLPLPRAIEEVEKYAPFIVEGK